VYYSLVLTNVGSSPCILQGYPGVSFVTGTQGQQVGAPAERISESVPSITLAPTGSASAVLQITDPTVYGPTCGLTPTVGLRVYPPNQRAALFIPHSDRGCSNPHDMTLHVGAFQTGTSG
jgi:hypothetical protein